MTQSPPRRITIAMLGLGSMNGAILAGLLASGVEHTDVVATTRSTGSAQEKSRLLGIEVLAEDDDPEANRRAAQRADVVFLGVKPYGITELAADIRESLSAEAVVVSVAAGITVEALQSALGPDRAVIRAMPNTPLSVGLGVVGLAPSSAASTEQVEDVAGLLRPCASVHVIDESQIDALTGVSGSGPAYAFYLAESMARGGVELGLDPELAAEIAAHTVYGAGKMLVTRRPGQGTESGQDAAQLRKAVCSPNGTTERAINTLDDSGFPAAVAQAVRASATRAGEMTQELCGPAD